MYLALHILHPEQFLVPCYDIDIAWHTHQVNTYFLNTFYGFSVLYNKIEQLLLYSTNYSLFSITKDIF